MTNGKHGGTMRSKRQHALRVTLPKGMQLRTSDDVVYAWVRLGSHKGWSRVTKPDEFREEPRLLVPATLDRALATALLDSDPQALDASDLSGAVLVMPGAAPAEAAQDLMALRVARINGTARTPNDATLTRASVAELLDLVAEHGLGSAARALQLRSLQVREELLARLGHQRVSELLATHPELPEEVIWQTMRSRGFDPAPEGVDDTDAVSLAGNPNLPQESQDVVIRKLSQDALAGDPSAPSLLARSLASPSIPEQTVAWLVRTHYEDLPRAARLALASNKSADWLWLRRTLDADLDPEVALASRQVGELSLTRNLSFSKHPDPGVRAAAGESLPEATWSWEDPQHVEVLSRIDDPLTPGTWSLEPDRVDPTTWGAYSVARQWAGRSGQHTAAEKKLRRLVDLHNRSWGAVGRGQGDPALAARADGARVMAQMTPELQLLGLTPGETYSLEEARLRMVMATAARDHADLRSETSPLVRAVLDACAAEAAV